MTWPVLRSRSARIAIALSLLGLIAWAAAAAIERSGDHSAHSKIVAADERSGEQGEQKGVFRTATGEVAIHLELSTQRLIGLRTRTLSPFTLRPEVAAYGVLQEDPSRTFTVRAPISGVLQAPEDGRWPNLGEVLPDDAVVGAIAPRVVPVERIDLVSRLATAQADIASTTASLTAAKAALARARTLNADDKIVSDRVLQDAVARVAAKEAQLKAAIESERLIAAALQAVTGPTGPKQLQVDRGGTVIAVFAQPGEAIEKGQPVVQVGRFDTLLAKVVVPSGVIVSGDAPARVSVIGREDHPLPGESIALVAVDPRTQGETALVRVREAGFPLRPGEAVTAYLAAPGKLVAGVVIPRQAIVRYEGKAWAYVKTASETFVQREVPTDHPVAGGWFVSAGFKPGDRVVTVAAEIVLSEELKAQIPSGEGGESAEQEEREEHER